MSSYVCSYVVKKVTAHYRICVRASRQTQHETSCLEEPRGGKLLGRAENFAPPGAQPGCLEARGGGKLLVPKNLAPPLGRNWRFVKGRPPRNCFKIGPLNDAPKSQILYCLFSFKCISDLIQDDADLEPEPWIHTC